MIQVSVDEARALKQFRYNKDADLIKGVLLRELNLTREKYESEPVDEETRRALLTYRRVLDVLFNEEVVKEIK